MAKTSVTTPPPRSDVPEQQVQPDLAADSSAPTSSQKRGRGRPPKAKSDSNQNDAVSANPTRRVSGRSKRNVVPAVATAPSAAAVKTTRARPKRSNPPPAAASQVTTTTVDASRKRGRPKKVDVAAAAVPATKRGRKPKIQVAAVNSVRRTTRKSTSSVAPVAANVGDLKKRTALLQKKVKEAAAKLQIAVTAIEAVQAIAAGM